MQHTAYLRETNGKDETEDKFKGKTGFANQHQFNIIGSNTGTGNDTYNNSGKDIEGL